MTNNINQPIHSLLQNLYLTMFASDYFSVAEEFERNKKTSVDYLYELAIRETEYRYQQRIKRLLKYAKLPRNKLLKDFEIQCIPGLSATTIQQLAKGEFMDRYENILIFGNPGTGKTHLSIALGREWCLLGRKVYYITAANLVQQLLQAKLKLGLENFVKKLDGFEILIIDDFSYVPYDRNETDVLFHLLSARYEMRSVLITSNLPFAKWDTIFKDEMTTTAAIDRLVHHSQILELNSDSYRMTSAKTKKKQEHLIASTTEKPQEQQEEQTIIQL